MTKLINCKSDKFIQHHFVQKINYIFTRIGHYIILNIETILLIVYTVIICWLSCWSIVDFWLLCNNIRILWLFCDISRLNLGKVLQFGGYFTGIFLQFHSYFTEIFGNFQKITLCFSLLSFRLFVHPSVVRSSIRCPFIYSSPFIHPLSVCPSFVRLSICRPFVHPPSVRPSAVVCLKLSLLEFNLIQDFIS